MEDRLLDPRVAECIGLWLAEGDNKTNAEITFTNNCWELIDVFYKTINKLFKDYKYNQRIYVYSPTKKKIKIPYKNIVVKYYLDKRATKPYFIFRIASVELIKVWKRLVEKNLNNKKYYPDILRGFFAGEGNIKVGPHKHRSLRVAQAIQKKFIENLFEHLNLTFSYEASHRQYLIHRKSNWDIFAEHRLADLHPDKKEKFWEAYNSYQQEHYEKFFLIKNVLSVLDQPYTTKQLSKEFNRSFARIQDVLIELKKQNKINNFRVRSVDYWTKNKNLIIISRLKKDYLLFLNIPKPTSEISKHFGVCWKSSFRRLKELEKLNLIKRQKNGKWIKLQTRKQILAI